MFVAKKLCALSVNKSATTTGETTTRITTIITTKETTTQCKKIAVAMRVITVIMRSRT